MVEVEGTKTFVKPLRPRVLTQVGKTKASTVSFFKVSIRFVGSIRGC